MILKPMINQSKLRKYIGKYSKEQHKEVYLEKIAYYANKQIGGDRIDIGIVDTVLNYAKEKLKTASESKTTNKYIVILYGPPASGKTVARNIACHLLKTYFEDSKSGDISNIVNSFIDTSVDDINSDIVYEDGKTVGSELIKIAKNAEGKSSEMLANEAGPIYMKHRKTADTISEMLMYFSSVFNKNFFVEISSPHIDYIENLLTSFGYYDYIPIIIYPFHKDPNVLFERSQERAKKDGRYIRCGTKHGIYTKAKSCIDNYKALTEIIKGYKNSVSYQYNTELYDKEDESKMKEYDLTELDKYTMHFVKKINGALKMEESAGYNEDIKIASPRGDCAK